MFIFIDSTVFFDAIEDTIPGRQINRTLRRVMNARHNLVTSLTVYGEILHVCFRDNRIEDLHNIMDLLAGLHVECWVPNPQLRDCCKCLDKHDKENYIGLSDRTHLAYSNSYDDHYFVTDDQNFLRFQLSKCKCKRCGKKNNNNDKLISTDALRGIL